MTNALPLWIFLKHFGRTASLEIRVDKFKELRKSL
jgi:hypothetical protein